MSRPPRGSCTGTEATARSDDVQFKVEGLDDLGPYAPSMDTAPTQDAEKVVSNAPAARKSNADERCASKDISNNLFALRIEVDNNDPEPVLIFFRKQSNGIPSKYQVQMFKRPHRVAISFTTFKLACRYAIVMSIGRTKVKKCIVQLNVSKSEKTPDSLLVASTKVDFREDAEFRRNIMQTLEEMYEFVGDMSHLWIEGGLLE